LIILNRYRYTTKKKREKGREKAKYRCMSIQKYMKIYFYIIVDDTWRVFRLLQKDTYADGIGRKKNKNKNKIM